VAATGTSLLGGGRQTDPVDDDVRALRDACERAPTAARALAADSGLWTWEKPMTTGDPAVQRVEFSVGDATMALSVEEIRSAVAALSS
jgi:hypothetical protein